MSKIGKTYDLEERTLNFSKRILRLTKSLSKNIINNIFISQIIRSGCSVGANYIEANESLGRKDFLMRVRISRKEAKETIYWLKLIIENNIELESRINPLLQEATELLKIFSSIIEKSKEVKKD
jgi:four helix bundle protein